MANSVDPVLQSQVTAETITDPLIRALYFGSDGTPGFYNQLQQAGANLIGSDVPLQQTAGLDSLENIARQSCLLYTSPSPRDGLLSRMPSSA